MLAEIYFSYGCKSNDKREDMETCKVGHLVLIKDQQPLTFNKQYQIAKRSIYPQFQTLGKNTKPNNYGIKGNHW